MGGTLKVGILIKTVQGSLTGAGFGQICTTCAFVVFGNLWTLQRIDVIVKLKRSRRIL